MGKLKISTFTVFFLVGVLGFSLIFSSGLQNAQSEKLTIPSGGGWVSLKGTGTSTNGNWKLSLQQDGYFVYEIDQPIWNMKNGKGTGTVSITATKSTVAGTCSTSGTFTTTFDVNGGVTVKDQLQFSTFNVQPSEFSLPRANCTPAPGWGHFDCTGDGCYTTSINPFKIGIIETHKIDNLQGNSVSASDNYSSNGNANWNAKIEQVVDPRKTSSSSTGTTGSTTSSDTGPFRFKVSVAEFASLNQKRSIDIPISINKVSGTSENVKLSVTNWSSAGLSASFVQSSIVKPDSNASSKVKITASCDTKPGDYLFTITGNPDSTGGESSQDAISIQVLTGEDCSFERIYDCTDSTNSVDESISCLENLFDFSMNDVDVLVELGLYQWINGDNDLALTNLENVLLFNWSDESVEGALLNLSIMCQDRNNKQVSGACDLIQKYDPDFYKDMEHEQTCVQFDGVDGHCIKYYDNIPTIPSIPTTPTLPPGVGSFTISDTNVEVQTSSPYMIIISGDVENYTRGDVVELHLSKPNGKTQVMGISPTQNGHFSTPLSIDHTWALGKYTAEIRYNGIIGQKSFDVKLSEITFGTDEYCKKNWGPDYFWHALYGGCKSAVEEDKIAAELRIESGNRIDGDCAIVFGSDYFWHNDYHACKSAAEMDKIATGLDSKTNIDNRCKLGNEQACVDLGYCVSLPCAPPGAKTIVEKVPSWIKNNAKWWTEGAINEQTFVGGLQYLIKENVITVPRQTVTPTAISNEIPAWVKTQTEWWANGQISEDEYLSSIEYLMKQGIINLDIKEPSTPQVDINTLVNSMNSATNNEDYDEARELAEQILEIDPKNEDAWSANANYYMVQGDMNQLVFTINNALKVIPDSCLFLISMGSIQYYEFDDNQKALEYFEKALDVCPDYEIEGINQFLTEIK